MRFLVNNLSAAFADTGAFQPTAAAPQAALGRKGFTAIPGAGRDPIARPDLPSVGQRQPRSFPLATKLKT